jgi:hypothetical protein
VLRRSFLSFLPLAPLTLLKRKSGVTHLDEIAGVVQCTGCLYQQMWKGEGEIGNYRIFIEEWHKSGCPFESRKGMRVYREEWKDRGGC